MKLLKIFPVAISLTLLSLSLYSPQADARRRYYRPRRIRPYKGRTVPKATRGGCEQTPTNQRLTPIAPISHIGQTATATPTVYWYVPDKSTYNITFRLWEQLSPEKGKILWTQKQIKSQNGLMQLTLPNDAQLSPNKNYFWQVVLKCNPSKPSRDQVISAHITYRPDIKTDIKSSKPADMVEQLTQAELWYDALKVAHNRPTLYKQLLEDLQQLETDALKSEDWTKNQTLRLTTHQQNLSQLLTPSQPVTN
ncbi:DUF928 domain-containing protein [filamentous cyanobacterium LEGE 11480]|uniref:DUF928 domain-containing protein n=1 Tax=Romeriopsis navalis LEGE 11480 TaxID=2777977 RepID=A0A928VP69_9CYAN|nr:DUF928 domain-containing protein [Romeriopsis navalis]MBE9031212.1 DUF928 domain-containing protein [Romeriopsis navalis LEGE 11480]